MKKSKMAIASVALASIGVGTLMYTYAKMHPIKAKAVAKDMKNVMKDLK